MSLICVCVCSSEQHGALCPLPPDCGPEIDLIFAVHINITTVFLLFIFTEAKPGCCPAPIPHFIRCRDECSSDSQCPKNLKCCYSGCGWQCLLDSEKPGVCPKPRTDIHVEVGCLDQCSTDSQCEGNLKCCFDGCGRCLPPEHDNSHRG
uniref:WAP domain-containing protein n=1 Tax=Periophthalmus magnuspinnatus TaxID=409849 RepID=A0A3B3Z976_9GOBI